MPPIYQPEVAARYIVDAAVDGRRAKVIGSWNKLLVAAGSICPGLANQYAALGAWDAQLTSQPVSPTQRVNLYHSADADADAGAHGIFDDRAGRLLGSSLPEDPAPHRQDVHHCGCPHHRRKAPAAGLLPLTRPRYGRGDCFRGPGSGYVASAWRRPNRGRSNQDLRGPSSPATSASAGR